MRYRSGAVGKVVMVRLDHGEPIVPALEEVCRREKILSGWFFLFGAVTAGKLVTGPKEPCLPPDPVWTSFDEPHEIVGMGSVAEKGGAPSLHLHSSLGRGKKALTGCLRKNGEVFLVVEALILQLSGIAASRKPDLSSGMELLSVE